MSTPIKLTLDYLAARVVSANSSDDPIPLEAISEVEGRLGELAADKGYDYEVTFSEADKLVKAYLAKVEAGDYEPEPEPEVEQVAGSES